MKRNIVVFTAIFLFFILSVLNCLQKDGKKNMDGSIIKSISANEAKELIAKNSDNDNFVILDIRTENEYKSGHIKDAENIDYYSESFKENINQLDKEKTYLVYCRSGNRSGKSMSIFKELGFKEVYDMAGGVNTWGQKGFSLVQ